MSDTIEFSQQIESTDNYNTLRIPPNSLHAEQALIGGLMLDNAAWNNIADKVNAGDFYKKEHRLIFQAITALAADNQPFDVITLSEQLERQGLLKSSGGLNYLVVIAQETPTAANILAYAKI
ncbi:DNA helicase, partial [Achromatium sp. WMS2]